MTNSMERNIRDRFKEAILSGDLETVRRLHEERRPAVSGRETGEREGGGRESTLVEYIAEQAAGRAQTEILNWCFHDAGMTLPPGETLNYELYHQACYSGSPAVFEVLVAHGLDLNAHKSEFVGDGLGLAAYHGNVALVRFLLDNGADPNTSWGHAEHETAVWAVAGAGPHPSLDILRLLLRYGWRQQGSGTHIAAAELGDLEALRLLVEAESAPDLEYVEDWQSSITETPGTALYRAALKGREETVTYLLARGADSNFRDNQGRSCAWAANQGGNAAVVEMLADRNVTD